MKIKIYSELQMQSAIGELRSMFKRTGYLALSASDTQDRSASQNAISHTWYEQVSRELGEDTPRQVKNFCKLHFGVPILRKDEHFRASYDGTIKGMTYEQKLKVMDILPVTSLMKTTQFTEYLEDVQDHYRGRVELLFPQQVPMEAAA